jgi:hypothetical protein
MQKVSGFRPLGLGTGAGGAAGWAVVDVGGGAGGRGRLSGIFGLDGGRRAEGMAGGGGVRVKKSEKGKAADWGRWQGEGICHALVELRGSGKRNRWSDWVPRA